MLNVSRRHYFGINKINFSIKLDLALKLVNVKRKLTLEITWYVPQIHCYTRMPNVIWFYKLFFLSYMGVFFAMLSLFCCPALRHLHVQIQGRCLKVLTNGRSCGHWYTIRSLKWFRSGELKGLFFLWNHLMMFLPNTNVLCLRDQRMFKQGLCTCTISLKYSLLAHIVNGNTCRWLFNPTTDLYTV